MARSSESLGKRRREKMIHSRPHFLGKSKRRVCDEKAREAEDLKSFIFASEQH
jgi:hypothetical protein